MKKAKVILSAIGIISAIGGVFAFKSQKFLGTWYCRTTTSTLSLCTLTATTNAVPTTIGYCTKLPNTTCTVSFLISRNQ